MEFTLAPQRFFASSDIAALKLKNLSAHKKIPILRYFWSYKKSRMGLGGRRGGAASEIEVAPTEDAVMAFLDLLVEPLLPAGVCSAPEEPPTAAKEAAVAKQVQAVVFLYDYYHRKLNPELEYLDFISFCKLAVVLKPNLLTYMKVMQRADNFELVDLEKEISLTEKMVMEACDLSKGLETLDTTADAVMGWPVSKVAVFLVDFRKENCFLLHSSSTQGVWSVIEKENSPVLLPEGEEKHKNKKKRITKKPPQRETKDVEEVSLQQLAFAAVKDACGCSQSNLKVLETHTVYSLSKEKTSARFYIVQCIESNNEVNYLPIKDFIDSLHGPLVTKKACSWSTTSTVEYFHVLPYADILSNWFLRNQQLVGSHEVGLEEPNHMELMTDSMHEDSDKKQSQKNISHAEEIHDKESSYRSEEPAVTLVYKKRNNSQKRCGLDESSGFKPSYTANESCKVEDKEFAVSCLPNDMEVDELASDSNCSINVKSRSLSGEDCADEMNKLPFLTTDIVKKEVLDGLQSIKEQNREIVSAEDKAVLSIQYGMDDRALLPYASSPKSFDKIHEIISSKGNVLSQTASKVLLRKRDMLHIQLRKNQDEIALCDKNIGTISRGGADALAVALDTLIEGCNDVNVSKAVSAEEGACNHLQGQNSSEYLKQKRLFEANLSMKNPCEELDQMCYKNDWPLPIYHVSTLESGCQSHVEVTGIDFKLTITGAMCATLLEAKELAASSMLIKLCSITASAS